MFPIFIANLETINGVEHETSSLYERENEDMSSFIQTGIYRIKCTVWVDRLQKAETKELEIEVIDSHSKIKSLQAKERKIRSEPPKG